MTFFATNFSLGIHRYFDGFGFLRDLVSSKQENYFLFFSRLLLTIILYSKKYLHVWGKKIVCAAMNDINSTLVLLISCFWFLYTNFTTMIKSIGRHCFFNLCVLFYMILTKPTLRAFIDLNLIHVLVTLFVVCRLRFSSN